MPINPADYRTPGQFLDALMSEKGWSQELVGLVLGMPRQAVGRYVRDEKAIDAPMALRLGDVFAVGPEAFLRLQHDFDLAKARITEKPDPARSNRARLLGDLPLSEMISRGWIDVPDVRDLARVESELARFFGVGSVEEIEILPHAAKRTSVTAEVTPAQLIWLYRVRQIAKSIVVPRYSTAEIGRAHV